MEILTLIMSGICLVLMMIVAFKLFTASDDRNNARELIERLEKTVSEDNGKLRTEVNQNIQSSVSSLGTVLNTGQTAASSSQKQSLDAMSQNMSARLDTLEGRFATLEKSNSQSQNDVRKLMDDKFSEMRAENAGNLSAIRKTVGEELDTKLKAEFKQISDTQTQSLNSMSGELKNSLGLFEQRITGFEKSSRENSELMRTAMERQLTQIREDNSKKLESISSTVNEKLDRRLNDSFKQVSERLEQVYKGLGEMQSIASGVGDLKKVLSNVKNRGILGEIQLGSILSDILAPEQYETDTAVEPGSRNRVEFAVKLPGDGESGFVYLPIDSKFPGDRYAALQDAFDTGSREDIERAKSELKDVIRKCAKDIRDKYIVPPYTTNFAVMFLPFEGLYAEVVSSGMVETLQRDFSVNIAGPSTMAALLNSLQMGFRTLAIQKRSNEVWQVLGAVKTEFGNFAEALQKTQNQLRTAENSLESLVGVRTRQMNKKLSSVESLPSDVSAALIDGTPDTDE